MFDNVILCIKFQTKLKRDLAQSVRNHKRTAKNDSAMSSLQRVGKAVIETHASPSCSTSDIPVPLLVDAKSAERCLIQLVREADKVKPSKVNIVY